MARARGGGGSRSKGKSKGGAGGGGGGGGKGGEGGVGGEKEEVEAMGAKTRAKVQRSVKSSQREACLRLHTYIHTHTHACMQVQRSVKSSQEKRVSAAKLQASVQGKKGRKEAAKRADAVRSKVEMRSR